MRIKGVRSKLRLFDQKWILVSESRKVGISRFRHFVAAPLQEYRRMGCRIDICVVEITVDVRQFHQPLVHDLEPKPGHIREDVHAEVTVWQLRQVLKMSQ